MVVKETGAVYTMFTQGDLEEAMEDLEENGLSKDDIATFECLTLCAAHAYGVWKVDEVSLNEKKSNTRCERGGDKLRPNEDIKQ